MKHLRPLIVILLVGMSSCATTTREAAPLNTQELSTPKAVVRPLNIQRVKLTQVLSGGPGRFFQQMPVMPFKKAGRFLGFQIMAMYGDNIPHPQGVQVGDIVTAVNGKAVTTPDQFIKVWNGMNKAQVLRVELVRNEEALRIEYPIVE